MSEENILIIEDVRVSFPHLFTPPMINGEEGKCGGVFMLENDRHAKYIKEINATIDRLAKEKLKGARVPSDRRCLRDGEDRDRPEYVGHHVLSANSKNPPMVIANDGKTAVTEPRNCLIYAGCYVNAKVQFWVQNNQYGKRINAALVSIQFNRDGEALDGSYIPPEEAIAGFGVVSDTEEDDPLAA